jgi:hypothetical protein
LPPAPANAHVAPPRRKPAEELPIAATITAVVVVATLSVMLLALGSGFSGDRGAPAAPRPVGESASAPERRDGRSGAHQPQRDALLETGAAGKFVEEPTASVPRDATSTSPQPKAAGPDRGSVVVQPDASAASHQGQAETVATPLVAALTAEQLRPLNEAWANAREALGQHDFERAQRELASASEIAVLPKHQDLVRRWQRLASGSREFWRVVAEAVSRFQGAEELSFDSGALVVLVVETGPDWITIRREGRNERYTLADLPPGLALAIAKTQLDAGRADHLVLLGACLATAAAQKPAYAERARHYWLQAQAAGADVEDLILTLSDPPELTP